MNTVALVVVTLVALQRLGELLHAARNTRALLAMGGTEVGRSHYPLIVAMHAAWLITVLVSVPPDRPPSLPLLVLYGLVEVARLWTMASLGQFWTTRVIALPGVPKVRRGPYRFVRHPNYMIVIVEIALLPLVFGEWQAAVLFSILNALLLTWRITVENRALAARP
ncbi:MAG TPA: isoprenylcysteine carboxylmethyltransferase family protein [Stellaceae bacterium]|nr:isoprenylcysteine carboxylmethyltransferase family protein [Stellaceae bacterium]